MSPTCVTGLGTLGSFGAGGKAFADAWARGRVPLSRLEDEGGFGPPGRPLHAARVEPERLRELLPPGGAVRRMSQPTRLLLAASLLALNDARSSPEAFAGDRSAVAFGTAYGPIGFTERLLLQVLDQGPLDASPFLFPECVANAPAGQVAIHCGARGSNWTFVERELGGLGPLARSARQLATGRAERALVGYGSEVPAVLAASLDRLGALAPPGPDGAPPRALPFGRERSGLVAAEGASVLVLESVEAAEAREAPVRALVRGGGGAFDPSATRVGWGTGAPALAGSLRRGLARLGVPLDTIDAACCGASGTRAGDLLEARVLRKLWGDDPPPVLAPKSAFGEYGGATLAAAVLALAGAEIGALAPEWESDEACRLRPFAGRRFGGASRLLVLGCAAGGASGWVLLEAP